MSFAWLDYLALAEALLQARTTLAPEEACCRAAISRAYYAVYGAARTRTHDQEGLQLPATGDAHQRGDHTLSPWREPAPPRDWGQLAPVAERAQSRGL
jgi:hypothetical protein